ncbi:hypothetical protein OCU04_007139 [Sclerotinia nivalis]|uniref:Uncharacterized protein n=1 Tax=Sclerotinia nivalis TaxID=352851 RepID=A0A9X0DIJ6_9HELO|nr:hypothetical protein OCU04_007139 [Sclerotinia nivalis]
MEQPRNLRENVPELNLNQPISTKTESEDFERRDVAYLAMEYRAGATGDSARELPSHFSGVSINEIESSRRVLGWMADHSEGNEEIPDTKNKAGPFDHVTNDGRLKG